MADGGAGRDGFDAVLLAGGLAKRLEGADKPALSLGGVTLLDRVVEACAAARDVVCVGPVRPTRRPVRWTREDPPGSGPAAALAAGLRLTRGPYVVVLAADLPFLTADVIHTLWTNAAGHDGAVLTDHEGRDQWLAACYRHSSLTDAITRYDSTAGLSLRRLLAGFDLARVPDVDGRAFDCDTWEDVAHVRRLVDGGGGDHRPPGAESEH
ncbi:molybdenum cofactor guanylyltransferase [Actinospica sp.]|uniref:molybdenum cofactor guanylyltransferase n=1 Tax=Actinospica sp. TaxID=1872142 RepID=UPI002BB30722|nr:molybdenum cofactor guanylyltransferase [Actinospica sp.]HWG24016.1 molybdenum cofactor guanylyltransferase [Actinospica sp.]